MRYLSPSRLAIDAEYRKSFFAQTIERVERVEASLGASKVSPRSVQCVSVFAWENTLAVVLAHIHSQTSHRYSHGLDGMSFRSQETQGTPEIPN